MPLWRILTAIFCLFAFPHIATASTVLAPPDTSSPYATMRSFDSAVVELRDAFNAYRESRTIRDLRKTLQGAQRITRLFDLDPLPPATRDETGRESVSLIMDILNRIPPYDMNAIPGAKAEDKDKLPARWTIPNTEIHIARTEAGPYAGEYQFTADTMRRLPAFHARIINEPPTREVVHSNWSKVAAEITGPLIPSAFVESLPESGKVQVFDSPVWKLVASALLFALFFHAGMKLSVFVRTRTRDGSAVTRLSGQLALPLIYCCLIVLWHAINVTQIHFFGDASGVEEVISLAAIYFCLAWAAAVLTFLLVEFIIATPEFRDDSYDAHLLRLIARVLSPIAFGVIIALGASDLGIPALGIVAGLGVGGIAVALAAQSTIDNLFGGLSIFADRPFRIGDFIRYGGESGFVQTIGLRSTRILSDDGNISIVPNGHLARISLTNVTAHDRTGVAFLVKLKSDSTPEQVTRCMDALKARANADEAISERRPSVRLVGFEAETIEIEINMEITTNKPDEIESVKNRLVIAFVSALRETGVTLSSVRAVK